ncbi:MAG TPA: histidine kinase dimerization/phospho-acceptor domain-containing protein [Acidimicrobiales bacterium]|jgi:signal transduction histidine kinase|nr:histidine kinase dimerization/phospho-acceptor domain-containing protein [Acidimicrobiales bacterium]
MGGARSGYRRQPVACSKPRRPVFREPWDGAISIVDADQRVLWGDGATERLLGATTSSAGHHLGEWLDPDELRLEHLAMKGLGPARPHYELEQRWPGPSGEGATVLVRGSRLDLAPSGSDATGLSALFVRQVLELAGQATPATAAGADPATDDPDGPAKVVDARGDPQWVALAEAELRAEQLEGSNRELSEFAYIAAHDLRAPLAALAGSAELLARRSGSELSHESQRHLAAVLAKVGTMGRMIDDILAFCRAGSDDQARQIVDCNDVIGEVLEHLAPDIFDARASLSLPSMGKVAGERTQLVQLFQNLIANALKVRRPG